MSQDINQRPRLEKYRRDLKSIDRLTPIVDESLEFARTKLGQRVVYIAGALTGVDESVKYRYQLLSEEVNEHDGMFGYAPHLHGTDPVKHASVSPAEVRDVDYLWAAVMPGADKPDRASGLHINSLSPMAHGNAIEEGWAEANDIPVIYLVPGSVRLSRLVKGMRNIAKEIIYQDFERDTLPQIDEYLSSLGN